MTTPHGETPFISIRQLTKTFTNFTALNEIDLDIMRGEFVCFLGPSGCGKTTLLRAIAGLDPQSSGSIMMDGRDISNAPPADRDFGIVFQSYALFPNLTVDQNVGYGLVNQGLGKSQIKARVAALLELVGLSDQERKYPVQLSGGQQQRVALARALAPSPGLLLLDEPLSALDARVRVRLREEIRSLHKRLNVTTIMVTHDQEEALSMAERIVVMNHGVIEQVGTPEDIYRRPATAFVADFVGRMNFMRGMVESAGRVRVGNHILETAEQGAVPEGTSVDVGLRPESIQIARGAVANTLPVVVEEIEFLGAFCRVSLLLAGTDNTSILADFSANVMADLGLAVGSELDIALPAAALRVFAAKNPQPRFAP